MPYREPSEDEVDGGRTLVCQDCDRRWPLSLCAIAIKRCVNCARVWWRKDKAARRGHYWRLYGLSENDVDAKLAAQDGKCAICDRQIYLDGRSPGAQLDHCHSTGHPRAFLCGRCNRGLGAFGDDPQLLRKAVKYLGHHVAKNLGTDYRRPRRPRALKGIPVRTRKPHHVLTASGRRIDLSDPNTLRLMEEDAEVAEAIDAYVIAVVQRR